ncbi:MAG: DUF642 domain-containing protein [Akkermansiaceae bacterium]|nr:DUF642 domain-containing protein [Akkermansiaceae bacterium]
MKSIHWISTRCIAALSLAIGFPSAQAVEPPVRILPLGDSLTSGESNFTVQGAYRNRLHTLLNSAGYNVDFLGTFSDSSNPGLPDTDHQGQGGARIDQIQANLNGWLESIDDPDVVLLLVGTNDFWQSYNLGGVQARYTNLIASIAQQRPFAKIVVASLPPRIDSGTIEAQQNSFNAAIPGIVAQQAALGRQVTFVDLHSALGSGDFSPDGVHPTSAGFSKLGDRWFPGVTSVISPQGTSNPPVIVSASPWNDLQHVDVVFSKPVSDASASLANFSVPGLTLSGVSLDAATKRVITLTTSVQAPGVVYTLGVNNVRDRTAQQNKIAPQSLVQFTSSPLVNGSFEDGYTGWTQTGNQALKNGPPYAPTDGTTLVAFGTDNNPPNAVLSQSFATTPGQTYQLDFDFGVLAFNTNEHKLRVEVTGSSPLVSEVVTLKGIGGGATRWIAPSYTFTANSATTELKFTDISLTTLSSDPVLDRIRISAVAGKSLLVTSTPVGGSAVNVSPADLYGNTGGTTGLIRSYPTGTSVTVTAPASLGSDNFLRWQKNGADLPPTAPTITVSMDSNVSLNAVYGSNAIPLASNDAYATQANGQLVVPAIGVLTNDSDPDGTPLTAVLDTPPSNGSLTLNPNGSFVYTPSPGFLGNDSFTYRANDGVSSSSVATVSITVNTASGELLANGSFESDFSLWTKSGNVEIKNAAPYVPTNGVKLAAFNGGQTASTGLLSQTVTTVPGQTYDVTFDVGSFGYTTNAMSVRFKVDAASNLLNQVVSVNGIGGGQTRWVSKSYSFTATGTSAVISFQDTTANGNSADLVLDNVRVSGLTVTHSLAIQSSPATGVLVAMSPPDVASLASASTNFTRTFAEGAIVNLSAPVSSGATAFVKWQKNGADYETTPNISVTVDAAMTLTAVYGVNNPPSADPDSYATMVDTALTVAAPGLLGNDSDPEETALTAVLDTVPSNGSLTLNPDGGFTYVPFPGFSGADSFTYHASDGVASSPTVTVTIIVSEITPGTLVNGSFEDGPAGWDTSAPDSLLFYDQSAPYLATDGVRLLVFNGGSSPPVGVVSQTFPTIPGQNYVLECDMGIVGSAANTQKMQVTISGNATLVSVQETLTGSASPPKWVAKSYSFFADSAFTTITFADKSTVAQSNVADMLLDNIRISEGTARVLTVNSSAGEGIAITVSPADSNAQTGGSTTFTRIYEADTEVTLTAPDTHLGTAFLRWEKDGSEIGTTATTTVTADANMTLTAVYAENQAPVATDDSYTTEMDSQLTVGPAGVLDNDDDPELQPMTASLVAGPSNGSLTLNPDGSFTYTPDPGYTGSDSFTYQANDGALDSNTATVDLTINEYASGALVNGSFEDGNTGWTANGAGLLFYEQAGPYLATDGTHLLVMNGGNTAVGTSVSQTVATSIGQTYVIQLDMGIVNQSPTTTRTQSLRVQVDGATQLLSQTETISAPKNSSAWVPKTFTFVADSESTLISFIDASSSTSAADLVLDNIRVSLLITRTLTVASSPDPGLAVTVSPADLASQTDGTTQFVRSYTNGTEVTLTAPLVSGPADFIKWTRNGVEHATTATTTVTMNADLTLTAVYGINHPPVAVADSYTTNVDTALTVPAPGVLANDDDEDGTSITAVLDTDVSHGTLSLDPNGGFTYTPDAGYLGPDSFTYHATDGVLDSAIVTVDLSVEEIAGGGLVNGSFEDGENGWTMTGSRLVFEADAPYEATDEVSLLAFNPGQVTPGGSISQSIATTPGQEYVLEFDLGVLGNVGIQQRLAVAVSGGGSLVSQTETVTANGLSSVVWAGKSYTFTAAASSTTITLSDVSTTGSSVDLLLDNIRLNLAGTRTLVVKSPGSNRIDVDVSPADNAGNTTGTTRVHRFYPNGTAVTVTAPATLNGGAFQMWRLDGADNANTPAVTVTMNGDHELVPVYSDPPQLLVNGSFEDGFNGWTKTGNLEVKNSSPYTATDGSSIVAYNTGQSAPNGTLSQTFPTIPGLTYQLSFDAGVFAYNKLTQSLEVSVNGATTVLSQTISINGPGGGGNRWLPFAYSFIADANSTTLTFRDVSSTSTNLDLLLDHVRVTGSSVDRTLTVTSAPATGVAIAVTPADGEGNSDGSTSFTRTYSHGTAVTLTAPASSSGIPFSKWQKNGSDFSFAPETTAVVDGDITLTAVYAPNTPPVAVADSYSTTVDVALNIPASGVLGNDTDADNDTLTAVLDVGPANGALTLNPDGGFTYTPNAGYEGADSFTYHADDGLGASSTVTVSIQVDAVIPGVLVNGSFEDDEDGWTITGNRIVYPLPSPYVVPDGNKVLILNTSQQAANAVISQTFYTVPGQPYTLLFEMGTTGATGSQQRLQTTIAGATTLVSEIDVMNGGGSDIVWQSKSYSFIADSNQTTLTFADVSPTSFNIDLFLDHVRIDSTAERTLTVNTNDGNPLTITVSPLDNSSLGDGAAPFDRIYPFNTTVTLTAPATSLGNPFVKWQKDGADYDTAAATTIVIDSDVTLTAIYDVPAPENLIANPSFESNLTNWTATGNLAVKDSAPYAPTDGVKLVAFNESNLSPNGSITQSFATTPGATYDLTFDAGVLSYNTTLQKLKVDVTGNGSLFSQTIDVRRTSGANVQWFPQSFSFVANSVSSSISFTDVSASTSGLDLILDNIRIARNIAVPLLKSLTIESSPVAAAIVVSPADSSGATNGTTTFSRSYPDGTTVTLTAPATSNGVNFVKWRKNGADLTTNATTTVTVDGNHTLTAVYSDPPFSNGSFETGSFSPWVASGGTVDSVKINSSIGGTDGTKIVEFNSSNSPAGGKLTQNFGTTPGVTYNLSFDLGVLAFNTSQQRLRVQVSGNGSSLLDQTATINGIGAGTVKWENKSFSFTANAATTTLVLTDTSATTSSIDMLLDNVRVTNANARVLVVDSIGVANTAVTVSPSDNLGAGNGTTRLTREFSLGTVVNVSVPATAASGANFVKWVKDGQDLAVTPATTVTITADTTLYAVYTGGTNNSLGPNLIRNGSFELSPDYLHWSHSGATRIEKPGVEFPDYTTDGINLLSFNVGGGANDGVVEQSFATTIGTTYTLRLDPGVFGGEGNGAEIDQTLRMQVLGNSGGTTVLNKTVTIRGSAAGFVWAPQTHTFVADSTSTILRLSDASTSGLGTDLFVDNVRVQAGTLPPSSLTIQSTPAAGKAITIAQPDLAGQSGGTTNFTRFYNTGSTVQMVAPFANFVKWLKNGEWYATNPSISVTVDDSHTMTAVYTETPVLGPFTNGSFESEFSGWTWTGSQQSVKVKDGLPATDGLYVIEFNSNSSANDGAISQTFTTTPGTTYSLAFDMGALAFNTTQQRLLVTAVSGTGATLLSQTYTVSGIGGGNVNWLARTASFTANASTVTLTFRDQSTTGAGIDLLLDNVRINGSTGGGTTTTRTLTVNSSPSAGAAIVVSPADNNSQSNGSTQFTRTYNNGASVTLTAPATFGGNSFLKWRKNGVDLTTNTSTTVTMDADQTLTAVYDSGSTGSGGFVNGSFENGLTNWISSGSPGTIDITNSYTGTDGTQMVEINSNNTPNDGSLRQTFATTAGAGYTVTFDMGVLAYSTNPQRLRVSATGNAALASQTYSVNGIGGGNIKWVTQTISFIADSTSTTLEFADVSSYTNGIDTLLDNIRVASEGSGTGPDLVVNGSFELSPDYFGWTQSGSTRIEKPGPEYATTGRNLLSFNVGQAPTDGMVSQIFATLPGATYELNFDVGTLGFNTKTQTLRTRVLAGSNVLLNRTSTVTCRADFVMVWDHETFTFTATSTSTTLEFSDASTDGSGLDLFIDTVTVNQMPTVAAAFAPALAMEPEPIRDLSGEIAPVAIQAVTGPVADAAPVCTGTPGDMSIALFADRVGFYALETSPDLDKWTFHSEIEVTEPGVIEFSDQCEDPPASRFYRIRKPSGE